ncbi:NAD(P)-dependent oxidoreductase [Rhizobium sp. PL01]|uniref:NAD(P)-dependent oxidoreductase n=1 Tax=Rhizobium sp. PL01 TaxID=3085631 RepID=UPI002980EE31|nr:NAD(P)-dependent oxidoreductase [Rhizobium sp. PL01]MDW5316032.1 NAD(P)-dependent oxidoreductase [Rhizobium sp. PL01]
MISTLYGPRFYRRPFFLAQIRACVCRGELDGLLAVADIVSLHCPLTNETRNLIDAETLSQMKPDALLINTARGGIIDEAALFEALRKKRIGGAALDSFSVEPPPSESPLWSLDNLIVTPRVAGVTKGSAIQMAETAARHIISVLNGNLSGDGATQRYPFSAKCVKNSDPF